jgi:hypothetical protein
MSAPLAGVTSAPAPSDDVLATALAWAERGRRVFPLIPGEKRPAVRWTEVATTDTAWITSLFNPLLEHGLGLPTGDGLIVVDVDLAKGAEIPDWLPATYTVRTQSGGLHLYYRVEDVVPNSAGRLGEAVDVRGDGGYVVAPPTPGYRVLVQQSIAPLDPMLLTAVQRRTGAFSRERNDWLLRACGHARAHGIDDEPTLLEWARDANQTYIDPPLDDGEVEHVVRNSLRYLGA